MIFRMLMWMLLIAGNVGCTTLLLGASNGACSGPQVKYCPTAADTLAMDFEMTRVAITAIADYVGEGKKSQKVTAEAAPVACEGNNRYQVCSALNGCFCTARQSID